MKFIVLNLKGIKTGGNSINNKSLQILMFCHGQLYQKPTVDQIYLFQV